MPETNIVLPSKPKVVEESSTLGIYEIDGLYPGYGHTLGNSLRRIILSSLPGAAITSVKIAGVNHEFSTIEGVKEDVIKNGNFIKMDKLDHLAKLMNTKPDKLSNARIRINNDINKFILVIDGNVTDFLNLENQK